MTRRLTAMAVAAMLMAACGGDDDEQGAPETGVSAGATAGAPPTASIEPGRDTTSPEEATSAVAGSDEPVTTAGTTTTDDEPTTTEQTTTTEGEPTTTEEAARTVAETTTAEPVELDLLAAVPTVEEIGAAYGGAAQGDVVADVDFNLVPRIDWCGALAGLAALPPTAMVSGAFSTPVDSFTFDVGHYPGQGPAVLDAAAIPAGCGEGAVQQVGGGTTPIPVTGGPLTVPGAAPPGSFAHGAIIADGSGGIAEAWFGRGDYVVRMQVAGNDVALVGSSLAFLLEIVGPKFVAWADANAIS